MNYNMYLMTNNQKFMIFELLKPKQVQLKAKRGVAFIENDEWDKNIKSVNNLIET